MRRGLKDDYDLLDKVLKGPPIVCKHKSVLHPICRALSGCPGVLQRLVDSGWYDLNNIFRSHTSSSSSSGPVNLIRSSILLKNAFAVKLFLERGYKIESEACSLIDLTQERIHYYEPEEEEKINKIMSEITHILLDHGVLDHEKGDLTRFLFASDDPSVIMHLIDLGVCPFTQSSDPEMGMCYYDYLRRKVHNNPIVQCRDAVRVFNHIQVTQTVFAHVLHRRLDGQIH